MDNSIYRYTYAPDIERCAQTARASYHAFQRTAKVAMLSARRPFEIVGEVVDDVEQFGRGSRWPSAAQWRGIEYLASDKGRGIFELLANDGAIRANPCAAMALATRVPALGLAKAGFLCQMMGIYVGCLDTHNIDMYELPRSKVRLRKDLSVQNQARSIRAYVELCSKLGGSVVLWGAWCEYLADLYPDVYVSGAYVSSLHHSYITGRGY